MNTREDIPLPTFFVVEDGETTQVRVDKSTITVGRSSARDIYVKDIRVSRHHCTLDSAGDDLLVLDKGTPNGTYVNGARVDKQPVVAGDRIDVGAARIYVERLPVEEQREESTWTGEGDRLYKAPLPTEHDQLERLQRIAAALNSELDLDRILDLIMDHVVEIAQAERGFLVLKSGDTITVPVARNFQREDVMRPEQSFSRSIADRVALGGDAVVTVDARSDNRFAEFQSIHEIAPRSVLCMPFRERGRTVGVVYIDNRIARGVFGREHLDALQSFADLAAGAILRAQVERERDNALLRVKAMYAELKNKYEEQGGRLQEMERVLEARQASRSTKHEYPEIVGESDVMRAVLALLDKIVASDETVLIEGENGTGKELIAQAIHRNSRRQKGPFIAENVAAIPETLVESELFGHTRGSFTGADRDKRGLFEQADGGTLFLDEVGDMPLDVQKKLLRVLETREVRRVGGKDTIKVDVRIISATNRDLRRMVEENDYREDLFYRLRVLAIELPSLRERRGDVALLATHFLQSHAPKGGRGKQMTSAALKAMEAYHWPGNIRELQNEVRRLVTFAGDVIHEEDLSDQVRQGPRAFAGVPGDSDEVRNLDQLVRQVEVDEIRKALALASNNKTKAAKMLGISRFTLQRKMEKYNLG